MSHQPPAAFVLARECLNFSGHRINPIVQPAPVVGQFFDKANHVTIMPRSRRSCEAG